MKKSIKFVLNLLKQPELYFYGALTVWFQISLAMFFTGMWTVTTETDVPVVLAIAKPLWVIVIGILLSMLFTLHETIRYYVYDKKHDQSFDLCYVVGPWLASIIVNFLILYRWFV